MKRNALLAIVATLVLGAPVNGQGGYQVIVNTANPVSTVTKSQVSKMFLDKSAWEDGTVAAPIDQPAASSLRDAFSREVLGLAVPFVLDRVKANGVTPAPVVASDREVLAYVRLKPGAIGYVSLNADVQGVKVISIVRKNETAPTAAAANAPVEVGGAIAMPTKLVHAQPVYPDFARMQGVTGTVELGIVIAPDGGVERAKVVRSIPALNAAAVAAVKQWRYKPTIVNGVAVPVSVVVQVQFSL
jgi:TonB family protein